MFNFLKKKPILRVHLKLQSHNGEERKPHYLAESIEVESKDGSEKHVIWYYDFKDNKHFQEFVERDQCLMLLPSKYKGVDFTMIVLDQEDWEFQKLIYDI